MANYKTGAQGAQAKSQTQTIQSMINSLSVATPNSMAGSGLNIGYNNLTVSVDPFTESSNPFVKKYQVLEIQEDLLALSATWYRLRQETKQGQPYAGISKLTDGELFKRVTEQDKELASNIRDYYSKKIMMWKLKGQVLTKFRDDMNTFIHSDGKIFKEDMCPLAYRLPEFYHYDIDFDVLTNDHNKIVKERVQVPQSKILKLHKTFTVGKRHSKRKEYWFSDQNDNLVTLSLTHDNPLLSLLDLASKEPLTVTAKFYIRDRDNVQYLYCDKYTFS